MYLCILVLPFLSFFSTNLFGRFIGVSGSCCLSTASIFCSFLLSFLMFYESSICSSFCTVTLCKWFHSELFISFWAFYFDSVSVVMLLVVSGVSMLVHFYSIEYMILGFLFGEKTQEDTAVVKTSENSQKGVMK